MMRWQLIAAVVVTLAVSAVLGFRSTKPAAHPVVKDAPKAQPATPVAAKPAPLPDSASTPVTPAQPDKAADPAVAKAPKAPPSGLPAELEKKLKLVDAQKANVKEMLKQWSQKLADIDRKKSEALAVARQTADKDARKALEIAAQDEWRQNYMAAKSERTQGLLSSLTPEQAAEYQSYRDKQYQSWLDQKVSMYSTLAQVMLRLTPEQVKQVEPLVRTSYDEVTLGGMSVPLQANRDSAGQMLQYRLSGILTPEQSKTFEMNKNGLTLQ